METKSYREGNNLIEKGYLYLKEYGVSKTVGKIKNKFFKPRQEMVNYQQFIAANQLSTEDEEKQRRTDFKYAPLISIVTPVYETNEGYFRELIESVMAQTYPNFQLCLADASADNHLEELTRQLAGSDYGVRICYKHLQENLGISGNTNAAIDMARGEYIAFCDHDDTLAVNALYEVVKALNEKRYDCVYSDEDKVSDTTGQYFEPNFKPDMNMDLLRANNYITHLFVCREEIVRTIGGLRSDYDGAQDHDFILRCTEGNREVYHIPKVLYHWRCHPASTAFDPASKTYAYVSGAKAVSDHYKRMGIDANVTQGPFPGSYRTEYIMTDKPLVSVIIPNYEHKNDLQKCLESLVEDSYKNIEIIIVENNSKSQEIFDYYDFLTREFSSKYGIPVRIIRYEKPGFNFSALINLGVQNATGDYLLLLNNDIQLIDDKFIYELVSPLAAREDIAITGAKLLYPDETVQHAGVILGVGGVAGHAFTGIAKDDPGYMFRAVVTSDLNCVTAAALMVKREIFNAVDGFCEELAVAFNDVDFCIRVRMLTGKLIMFNPYAIAFHFESKSRGLEETDEQKERFNSEVRKVSDRFDRLFMEKDKNHTPGVFMDTYYNPNLSYEMQTFVLSKISK